ncbi:IS3 family transposase [Salinimicrobium tongyeongense]|uniref:IS3 family transposase n=1 Tax=Salinimicrobium tongyeongense TaxID=2809707 RepID=UPI0022369216|nr:IS3 family transposase [Salinimicrobium tongyeongense]
MQELRQEHALEKLLKHAGMARSTFYYHLKASKQDKYEVLRKEIRSIYDLHKGRYGYRRIQLTLKNKGYVVNHKTVFKLMQELGISSLIRVKKYTSYRGNQGKIAANLLKQNFKADRPNLKWATDVTEFKVKDKKLYLSPIIDLFNGEVLSFTISERPNFKQVMDMINKCSKQEKQGLILHSDQGWQYQMKQYQKTLQKKNITQSMSRKGNCLDNAVAENFFGTLKSELYYLNQYNTVDQLKQDIKDYIKYYNYDRIRLNLNGMSPIQYRAHVENLI